MLCLCLTAEPSACVFAACSTEPGLLCPEGQSRWLSPCPPPCPWASSSCSSWSGGTPQRVRALWSPSPACPRLHPCSCSPVTWTAGHVHCATGPTPTPPCCPPLASSSATAVSTCMWKPTAAVPIQATPASCSTWWRSTHQRSEHICTFTHWEWTERGLSFRMSCCRMCALFPFEIKFLLHWLYLSLSWIMPNVIFSLVSALISLLMTRISATLVVPHWKKQVKLFSNRLLSVLRMVAWSRLLFICHVHHILTLEVSFSETGCMSR